MSQNKLLAIGECMLEISGQIQLGSQAKLNFGGDVLNTALYYARLDGEVSFLTALGDDNFSNQMISHWNTENIDTSKILKIKERVPGLYAIQTDNQGERSFYYWREQAPIKDLFYHLATKDLNQYDQEHKYLYFSGISLSRWDDKQLEIFANWLKAFRNSGNDKEIIFDLNYRPKCWQSKEQTRVYLNRILKYVTIVLTTFDDEELLFNASNYQQTLNRYNSFNIPIVVIKHGTNPTVLQYRNQISLIKAKKIVTPVDTTAAGDSFNAAFLAAFANDISLKASINFAQIFAAEIIQHQGAIIDKKDTDKYINKLKELTNANM
ncbi:2-dehydro-3-deoxygluconokinase [Francisella halioticida]|uniref:2-dehydro-3-deoxygluconokinase n=1 Tax=Francisella halioticida TaxID=549298 RepID=A0ABN5B0A0_9GAMM|nr:sugar kinase [Francisella halioticida]ASG67882.1 2-dehydro-3-deoxygluconokinase [Francisella halioticida]BCD90626.1 2-dehydro-3-deoxygluconokinase [Francisella halioticida]